MQRLGFCQFSPEFGARESNLETMASLAAEAGEGGLLVFPELAVSGYEFRDRREVAALAEPFRDGPTARFALALGSRTRTTVVIGYPERDQDRLYNSCLLAGPGELLANYRKLHLFGREKSLFDAGDGAPTVVPTPAGRVGMMICFDWAFPEVARSLALDGAQILAHPANLVLTLAQRVMVARSIENGVYSVTANRVGVETRAGRTIRFTGGSQIVGPRGDVLGTALSDVGCVATVGVDLALADDKRVTETNDLLEDRRPGFYGRLLG